jgi:hypothetical protein
VEALRRAVRDALPGGQDTLIAAAEQNLAAVQRQALRRVSGFGVKLFQRWFPPHQSSSPFASVSTDEQ